MAAMIKMLRKRLQVYKRFETSVAIIVIINGILHANFDRTVNLLVLRNLMLIKMYNVFLIN